MNFKDDGSYPLFYEPSLVSGKVKTNILGAKTEARSTGDLTNKTLVYATINGEKITVPCYKEQLKLLRQQLSN